jgi:predicted deacetylase
MRLDDACEKRDVEKWDRMESILDKYRIRPLVGIIPHCEDPAMNLYPFDSDFWNKVNDWRKKGWTLAMHGYNHVYATNCGGINPVNKRSEFAGVPLEIQKQKIRAGIEIFRSHGINPKIFFAPSHTFDENTLLALKEESDIRIISDTIANKAYSKYDMTFVPQQSGRVRKLPFNTVTFCYHPNIMKNNDFLEFELFLQQKQCFVDFPANLVSRKFSFFDALLKKLYYAKR